MNKLAELRQRASDLKAKGDELLKNIEAAESDNKDTAGLEKEWATLEADLKDISAQIEREEQLAERRRSLEAVHTVPARSITSNEQNPALTGGFQNIAEFAIAVRKANDPVNAMVDQRLRAAPSNYHEGGGSSGEGYMLPVQFRNEIWEAVTDTDDLISSVDLEPTQNRRVEMGADETTPWGATGISASWRAEGSQMSASKLVTEGRGVDLHELYAFVLATEEMREDAPRLEDRIRRKAALAMSWKISDAIVYGTGAGQPLGFFNSGALVTVPKESGQAADTLDDQNVLKMYSRLMVAPGDMPYWLANRDVVPQLATLQIGDMPVWMPPNGLIDAPGGILLGYPVRFSEHAKTLGDKGDLMLISPKGYYAARRTQGPTFAQSMHLYFDYNMEAYRWTFRFGGQPYLSAPVSPANGSNTKSHFVALAERA